LKQKENIKKITSEIKVALRKRKTVMLLLDDFDMINYYSTQQQPVTNKNDLAVEDMYKSVARELLDILFDLDKSNIIIATGVSPINSLPTFFKRVTISYDSRDTEKMLHNTFDIDFSAEAIAFIKKQTKNTYLYMNEIKTYLKKTIGLEDVEKSYNMTIERNKEIFNHFFRSIKNNVLRDKIVDCLNKRPSIVLTQDEAEIIINDPDNKFFYTNENRRLLYDDSIPFVKDIINNCDLKRTQPLTSLFLSYNSEDRERVSEVVHKLTKKHIRVYWDKTITPGEEWDKKIRTLIKDTKKVLVLIDHKGLGNTQKTNEIDFIKSVYDIQENYQVITCFLCDRNDKINDDLKEYPFLERIHLILKQETPDLLVEKICLACIN